MNESNQISHHTKLYGFIGEEAGKSSLSASMNRFFREKNRDAMTIPMNIREDDFYFTISNMKKSHVNGAIISNEFITNVVELLDEASDEVIKSGMCDILVRDKEKLKGDIFSIKVLIDFLKSKSIKKIALIGINPHAKAFSLACGNSFEISYFNDNLEELMTFINEMNIDNANINRIADGMSIDLSDFEATIDFSNIQNFNMLKITSKLNMDMKQKTEISALKKRVNELESDYIGYDDLLQELSQTAYDFFKNYSLT